MKPDEVIYTREEAAALLHVSFPTLRKWAADGVLVPRSLGRRVYYLKKDILKALKSA